MTYESNISIKGSIQVNDYILAFDNLTIFPYDDYSSIPLFSNSNEDHNHLEYTLGLL